MFWGLSFKELARRVWQESNEDNVFGRAAELAYFFMFSLFPMIIFLTNLIGFMPELQTRILNAASRVAPAEVMVLLRQFLDDIALHRSGGLLSLGLIAMVWAASNGVAAVIGALNTAYEVTEARPYWKRRLVAMALMLALAVLVVGGSLLIVFGDRFAAWGAGQLGLPPVFFAIWRVVDLVLGLFFLLLGLELIYFFGPNVKQSWAWISPGAIFAVVALLGSSWLFSAYLRFAPSYSATYGSLGAVMILMLWLYLMGIALMFGGEINAEVRRAKHARSNAKKPADRQAA